MRTPFCLHDPELTGRNASAQAFVWIFMLALFLAVGTLNAQEPPHPILTISGSGSGADNILNTYTESQYLQFVPMQAPRASDQGFAANVVPKDTDWSWSAASPNQITSLPSGTVFPNPNFTLQTAAVPVLSGKTVNIPYYLAAGSTSRKSLVFALIDLNKRGKLQSDLGQLAAKYMLSGTSPATRDDRYARRIAVALDGWADAVPDYFMTAKNSPSFISAAGFTQLTSDIQRASDHNGLAHEWSDTELKAFDAIYDSTALANLSAEKGYDVRQHIANGIFFNIGDFFVQRVPVPIAIQSNLSGPYEVLAETARVLNRPDYIIWMDGYLDATVRQKINRDGVLGEGISYSVGYVDANLNAAIFTRDYFLTRPADTQALIDIHNRTSGYVNIMNFGKGQWTSLRLPDGTLPSFGDTNFDKITARNRGVSGLLPAYGHVAMGMGTGSGAVQVSQNFSDDANHMRADVTGFVLWANNAELLGNTRYYHIPGRQFDEQILAYNAVTIDRVNMSRGGWTVGANKHKFTSGNLTLYEPGNNGLAVTELDGQRPYANKASRYQRLLVLNTVDPARPYVVDLFRITGGQTHDYTFHGAIRYDETSEASFPLTPNPAQFPMLEGNETWVEPTSEGSSFPYYGFWRNVSQNPAPGDFNITYRDTSTAHRDIRLWMTDTGPATVYLGQTPNPGRDNNTPPNFYTFWRPSLILRHRINSGTLDSLFAGVVEPLNAGVSTIQSVTRVPVANPSLDTVALQVTFVDGRVDTLLVNLDNPTVTGAPGVTQGVATADGQYSLTGRVGLHVSGGPKGEGSWTVDASDFHFGNERLTPAPQFYQGTITGMFRQATGGDGDAFVTNAVLPLGTALAGRQLSLIYDTYHVVNSSAVQKNISEMFQIDHITQDSSGQTDIYLTHDHQLVMDPNTGTIIEQMAPQRTFTGMPPRFEIALSASGPMISNPGDGTVEATGPDGAAVSFGATATDSAGNPLSVTFSPAPGSTFPLGTTTVTATAADAAGNAASTTFKITVQDTTPPALTLSGNLTVEATGPDGAVANYAVTAHDLVSGDVPVTLSIPSGSTFSLGTTTVTASATDAAGNTATSSFTVSVVDTTAPTLTLPANLTLEATGPDGAVATYSASAHDAVSGDLAVTLSIPSGSMFSLGTTTVTATATDAAGNTATGSFMVTVADTTPPTLTLPGNLTLEATSPAGAVATYAASARDIVSGDVAVTLSPASGSTFPPGATTVTATATDTAGNTATGSFTVTVADTTPPTLTLPGNRTLEATSPAGAVATYTASAHDVVSGDVAVTLSPASGSTFPLGSTTVSASAKDAAGNTATGAFTITVVDTTPPVLTLPGNLTLEATGPAGAVAIYTASAHDLVSGDVPVVFSIPSGSVFPLGTTTVTTSAKDAAGNTASGAFTITVVDTTPPVIQSLTATPGTLWPPNGRLVEVTLTAVVHDVVDPSPLTHILSVSSNEQAEDHDRDDRHDPPDWIITGPLTVKLRAEHSGRRSPLVYTIMVESRDALGNASTKTISVPVRRPRDRDDDDGKQDE
jgi:hypothetical protein